MLAGMVAALCLGGWLAEARAATFRVDDSGTRISSPITAMKWRKLVPGRFGDDTAEGEVRVAVRLNLSTWTSQRARLYMALAPTASGDVVKATWRTQGRLLPGSVASGGRTLVYEGLINSGTLEETLDMVLTTDGRNLESAQSLQFFFEIEVP